jgi:predicted nucleic acid-binding protein
MFVVLFEDLKEKKKVNTLTRQLQQKAIEFMKRKKFSYVHALIRLTHAKNKHDKMITEQRNEDFSVTENGSMCIDR